MSSIKRRAALSYLALLLAGTGVTACSKSKPALVPAASLATLNATPGDIADFHLAASAADTVIPIGEALRKRARAGVQLAARLFWVPGAAPGPGALFAGYQAPTLLCPAKDDDGDGLVCLFLASPRPETLPSAPRASLNIFVAIGLTAVSHGDAVEQDARPMLEPGTVTTHDNIDGSVAFNVLGKRDVTCRADLPAGGHWERRTCALQYGPYWLHVSRDVPLGEGRPFSAPSDDPALMRDVADAVHLLAATLTYAPPLQRALPPVPGADDGAAMFLQMAQQGSAGSMASIMQGAGQAAANTPSNRTLGQMAKNGAKLIWHDARRQSDFDLICRKAAEAKQPIAMLTGIPSAQLDATLYGDQYLAFASKAQLIVVRPQANDRANAWAVAFTKAIGASPDPSITLTGVASMSGDACKVAKVYQSSFKDQQAAAKAKPAKS